MTLQVIVVPPDIRASLPASLRDHERPDDYQVVLGDCIMPGFVLEYAETADAADTRATWWANHYGLRARLMNSPGERRSRFVVLHGGLVS